MMHVLAKFAYGGLLALGSIGSVSAQSDGEAIQAFGNDPNWTIIVRPQSVTYTKGGVDFPIFYRLAAATADTAKGGKTYRTKRPDGVAVELTVTMQPCVDDGETVPMTAILRDGDKTRKGCARSIKSYPVSDMVLNGLSMNSRIVSHGGPKGFKLELAGNGSGETVLTIDGQDMALTPPMETIIARSPWPTMSSNVARFRLVDESGSKIVLAEIRAESCMDGGKTYPMKMAVALDGKKYESCASHAYMAVPRITPVPTYGG